ncbi:MAG TPA: hypothetical protein VGH07_00650 [Chthoniobacterales bacterium]
MSQLEINQMSRRSLHDVQALCNLRAKTGQTVGGGMRYEDLRFVEEREIT